MCACWGWQTSVRSEQHLKQPFLDRQIQGLGENFRGDRFVLIGRKQAVSWASLCKPWTKLKILKETGFKEKAKDGSRQVSPVGAGQKDELG